MKNKDYLCKTYSGTYAFYSTKCGVPDSTIAFNTEQAAYNFLNNTNTDCLDLLVVCIKDGD